VHFAHLANTLIRDEESARDNHVLSCNFAKYSPILNIFFNYRVRDKPFLIWLLTTPPDLKYVATLRCTLLLMACFADINVSQGSVATCASCGGTFNIHLTANLPRNLPVKVFKSVNIWQNYGHDINDRLFGIRRILPGWESVVTETDWRLILWAVYAAFVKRCSQLRLMWLRRDCDCDNRATSSNIVQFCNCDATAMWLQTKLNMFIFSARLHKVAANHNAGIGMGVVDQRWRHCLLLFSCVLVN